MHGAAMIPASSYLEAVMIRFVVGLLLGLSIGAASADSMMGSGNKQPFIERQMYLNAGVGPDSNMAPIRVDKDGYVICSTEHKP
jgi:hypothetical protein